MINDSPVQQIRDRLDIVEVVGSYIKLQKTGINYRAVCPFHSEKKPSFFVSPSRQMFKCFGCGESGSIFDFVMKIEGLEFGDALRLLARKAGVELKSVSPELMTQRQRVYEICELACCFFQKQLKASAAGKAVLDYLLKRGLTAESIAKWRLGYAPDTWQGLSDFLVGRGYKREEVLQAGLAVKSEKSQTPYDRFRGRIIFPVFDFNSQVIGFGGRITERPAAEVAVSSRHVSDDLVPSSISSAAEVAVALKVHPREPKGREGQDSTKDNFGMEIAKYINIPNTLLYDKSRVLYGLNFGRVAIRKKNVCILTEGYTDVILSHQAGFENTVASSGTSLTAWQIKILKRYTSNLLIAFDMDTAGNSATKKGIDLAQAQDFTVKVISMPQGKDPADVIAQSPSDWQKLIEGAKHIMDFYFDSVFSQYDKESPEGKKEISKALLPRLKQIPNKILQAHWVQKLANAIRVGEEAVIEELKKFTGKEAESSAYGEVSAAAPSAAAEPAAKTRSQLLEEKILSLIIASPRSLRFIEDDCLALFSSQARQIFSSFKKAKVDEKENIKEALAKLERKDDNLKEILDTVAIRAEVEETAEPEQEIQLCLDQLKEIFLKKELTEISLQVKTAEQQGDEKKLRSLMERFNQTAKHLTTF